MADFNWADISDNMDWSSLNNKNKNVPNSGNASQNNTNRNGSFGSNTRGRGRGGGGNFFKQNLNSSDNPNLAPLGNRPNRLSDQLSNRLSGNFSNLNYQEDGTDNFEDADAPAAEEEVEGNDEPHSYETGEVHDWNDMKQFDDDHDNEWFIAEENKMAEKYGGKFIKVRYTSQGRVGYHCELCLSECNAKKSLELHCGGMKHLKKKDLWEKNKRKPLDEEENPIGPVPPSMNVPKQKKQKVDWPIGNMPPKQPPAPYGDPHRGDGLLDLPYMRKPPAPYGDPHRGDGLLETPYRRGYEPPINRFETYYGKDRSLDSSQEFSRRGRSPSPRHGRMYPASPERKRMSSSRHISPPYGHHGGNSRDDDWSDRSRYRLPREKSPIDRYRIPSPPHIPKRRSPSPSKKLSLAGSPAGALLQKLAECCVKTEGDADLALSVVGALTKSMKEFAYKNNEIKIAELLMEAELKVGTVKALKAGMKMLSTVSSNAIISKAPQLNVAAKPKADSDLPNVHYQSTSTQQAYRAYSGNTPTNWMG